MTSTQAFFLGVASGAVVAGVVIIYAVGVLMPERRWLR